MEPLSAACIFTSFFARFCRAAGTEETFTAAAWFAAAAARTDEVGAEASEGGAAGTEETFTAAAVLACRLLEILRKRRCPCHRLAFRSTLPIPLECNAIGRRCSSLQCHVFRVTSQNSQVSLQCNAFGCVQCNSFGGHDQSLQCNAFGFRLTFLQCNICARRETCL